MLKVGTRVRRIFCKPTYKVQRLDIVYKDDKSWRTPPVHGAGATHHTGPWTLDFPDGLRTFADLEYKQARRSSDIPLGDIMGSPDRVSCYDGHYG